MHKNTLKLLASLCFLNLALNSLNAEKASFELELQTGYRQDHLIWSMGHPSGKPNILSELQWNDLKIWENQATLRIFTSSNYYARVSADYGKIFSGKNQDSDYLGNHRTDEYSRSKSDASSGHVYDLKVAFGKQLHLFQQRLKLIPLIGYNLSEQHLKMKHGVQLIDTEYGDLGPIKGLNNSYIAKWFGPFVGFDLKYQLTPKISFSALFEYHFARFNGFGDWNLRPEFYRDFEHTANARGIMSSIGAHYQFNERLYFGLNVGFDAFKGKHGRDRTYIMMPVNQVMSKRIFNSPLKSVKWCSFSALGSAKLEF